MKTSVETYKKKYAEGWYPLYPEGDIIRFYHHFINGRKGKLLDFGCANGTTCVFFKSKGLDVYGVDVIPDAIKECQRRMPENQFKLIQHGQDVDKLFDTKFDVIVSRQVLYYLSESDMQRTLRQFDSMLNPDGLVYFTMMSKQNYYWKYTKPEKDDGLQEVSLKGRLNETTYINFIDSEDDLKNRFKIFKPLLTGYYDITIPEGSTHHYFFVGQK